jgi:hypothetical protein
MSFLQIFIILVVFFLWPWKYQPESIPRIHSLYQIWVETHFINMLFNGQSFIETTLRNGRFLFLTHLKMSLLPMFHAHLQYREHVSYQVSLYLLINRSVMIE